MLYPAVLHYLSIVYTPPYKARVFGQRRSAVEPAFGHQLGSSSGSWGRVLRGRCGARELEFWALPVGAEGLEAGGFGGFWVRAWGLWGLEVSGFRGFGV